MGLPHRPAFNPHVREPYDIAVIGAGAAGLMSAIWAGRTARERNRTLRIAAIDGATKIGSKILVAGGGRCNVTHDVVDETAFAGSSRHAIKQVLRAFGIERTVAFFRELGVELKREETGKLFPITDDAHTVLDALLGEAGRAGAELVHPWRVRTVRKTEHGFEMLRLSDPDRPSVDDQIDAARIILCTGGKSLPKTGSDGGGYEIARSLGHSLTPRITPALVPITLTEGSFVRELSGLTLRTTLEVWSSSGKRLVAFTDSTLCTHFGLSGPSVLDISRHWIAAKAEDPGAMLAINWAPGQTPESIDALLNERREMNPARVLMNKPLSIPERLARSLCGQAGVVDSGRADHLPREKRKALATAVARMGLPVTGDRGYNFAEVTAGGVPLSEVRLDTMESRVCPGLHLAGEVLDVDGRIGGYNFQWAWASGHLAGAAAAKALAQGRDSGV